MKREIPRGEWRQFLESFTLQHDGWLVNVFGTFADPLLLQDTPLQGVVSRRDETTGELQVIATVGKRTEDHRRIVSHRPVAIRVESENGVDRAVEIESEDGSMMRLAICAPIAPELVDGIMPKM